MGQQDSGVSDSQLSDGGGGGSPDEIVRLPAARGRAIDEAGATIARQLNGPLTALLLYMGEIKQHSHQFAHSAGDRDYLQKVVDNALKQTERVCALVKQMGGAYESLTAEPDARGAWERRARPLNEGGRAPGMMFAAEFRQKPLTKREREVLDLISRGYSNKQGALRMQISPRTFESHRAERANRLGLPKLRRHSGAMRIQVGC